MPHCYQTNLVQFWLWIYVVSFPRFDCFSWHSIHAFCDRSWIIMNNGNLMVWIFCYTDKIGAMAFNTSIARVKTFWELLCFWRSNYGICLAICLLWDYIQKATTLSMETPKGLVHIGLWKPLGVLEWQWANLWPFVTIVMPILVCVCVTLN